MIGNIIIDLHKLLKAIISNSAIGVFMQNKIMLTANALPGDLMEVVLRFDAGIIRKDKEAAEQDIIALFVNELSIVTDRTLGFNYELMNMKCATEAIN